MSARFSRNVQGVPSSLWNWLILLGAVFFIGGCDGTTKAPPSKRVANDPLWSQFIAERTAGQVSKHSKIQVRFVNDVIREDQVGHAASNVLSVEPPLVGEARFTSPRDLVLTPYEPLKSGQNYHVVVHSDQLLNIPPVLATYNFAFSVVRQAFDIDLSTLAPVRGSPNEMVLSGTIQTADEEDARNVEKMLRTRQPGQKLTLTWDHSPDRRRHEFSIGGIRRDTRISQITVEWDGAAIGLTTHTAREVEVPPRDQFVLASVNAHQGEDQHIELTFSEPLDPKQRAENFLQLSTPGFSARIEGHTLRIYPNQMLSGPVELTIHGSLRSASGATLGNPLQRSVHFDELKPQIRFVGKGNILPGEDRLTIPIEAVNVNAIHVTAFRIYENNMGQFLQTNGLDGTSELARVGRYLWRKTVPLTSTQRGQWQRYSLDVTELARGNPGALFRLTLSIDRRVATVQCPAGDQPALEVNDAPLESADENIISDASGWDFADEYYDPQNNQSSWGDRDNPCANAYYRWSPNTHVARNFIGSNIGLIAKRDTRGDLLVVATDLATAQPLPGTQIEVLNFQNQRLHSVTTNSGGFAQLHTDTAPYYLVARNGAQVGYLKTNPGTNLPTSHFDVGGQKTDRGIKGFLYGERGIWRPGDTIYLTFVLQDPLHEIPDRHPVTLQLRDPKGQLVKTATNASPVGTFYTFSMTTAADAPTGTWTAQARLGGSIFTKSLKIETIMPNRLKVEWTLDEPANTINGSAPLQGKLFAQWLNGATAKGLKADLSATLTPSPTEFTRAVGFNFDDRTREFRSDEQKLFEGALDDLGYATIAALLTPGNDSPGMLNANFSARVFEPGGAFSINRVTQPYHPYTRYVGIKLPKGDVARGMLLTDTDQVVELASLTAQGEPANATIELSLYKISWKWWWDKSGESLAQYATATHNTRLQTDVVSTVDGKGQWHFQVKYPDWGRYLVRACDTESRHCTSQVFYMDWPGWAGRAREESSSGANVLSVTTDKTEYTVGETATVQLPDATRGRALVTLESGSRVIDARWVELGIDLPRVEFAITAAMSPTVYANVTLLQPHTGRDNDRPLRLYGMTPLKIIDPATRLQPRVTTAPQWKPHTTAAIEVTEAQGRAMTYTLAVVDEGLLGLTNYKTPDLHQYFYQKESLGVTTWDLFDDVAGAYAGELERILALGGDNKADTPTEQATQKRFPPIVKFLGPFALKAGTTAKHDVTLPEYGGAVRLMVVAGERGAYGSAETSVIVRDDLAVLPTLPRVLSAGEELTVPVSVFAFDPAIRDVRVHIESSNDLVTPDNGDISVHFNTTGEQTGMFHLRVKAALGHTTLRVTANSGTFSTKHTTEIDVRSANPTLSRRTRVMLKPGESWKTTATAFGIEGSDRSVLEFSSMPPLNLESRLAYLIHYPYGCVEQTTSGAFPQLYLSVLSKLSPEQAAQTQKNVQAGIERLRQFQNSYGGFSYWPGQGDTHDWASIYVTHFLVEAERAGYAVPPQMKSSALDYLNTAAQRGMTGYNDAVLEQSYRLMVLALAQRPNIGAMNRLREDKNLSSAATWQLAGAYALSGMSVAAHDLLRGKTLKPGTYATAGRTFGSTLNDQAIYLHTLTLLGDYSEAHALLNQISEQLGSDAWLDTHAIAYSLVAAARLMNTEGNIAPGMYFEERIGTHAAVTRRIQQPMVRTELALDSGETAFEIRNLADGPLNVTLHQSGIPALGAELPVAEGLSVDVSYATTSGDAIEVTRVQQNADLIATVRISNQTFSELTDLALTQMVPSGWEIHNPRISDDPVAQDAALIYQDLRDDRVLSFFALKRGEFKEFKLLINATYLGHFYLPAINVESMYNAKLHANTAGQWVDVVKAVP